MSASQTVSLPASTIVLTSLASVSAGLYQWTHYGYFLTVVVVSAALLVMLEVRR